MPDASHDFGAHLRQAREQRGVSLREIAARTKISVLVLDALERNDVSRLPGGIFTRAFVRSYAAEVGLDPEDAVRRFLSRFPDESGEEEPRRYEPNPEHISVDEPPTFGRAWRAVAWSIPLLLVVAYFGFGGRLPWWGDRAPQPAARSTETPTPPPPPPAPVQAVTPGGLEVTPSENAASAQGEAVGGAAGAPVAADPSAPAEGATPAAPSTAVPSGEAARAGAPAGTSPSATAGASQAAVPAATPGSAPAGSFRLTLVPREACWVSVRSNGASVYSSLMRAGERQDLMLHGEVSLTVGNAGAFAYFLDDQPGRTLGGPGQVTTVRLNAENFKTFIEPR